MPNHFQGMITIFDQVRDLANVGVGFKFGVYQNSLSKPTPTGDH
jgi:hypothetical protein